jgi:hypothetical protein
MKKNGIIGKIAGGFADSTRAVHEINKEHMAAVKADSKALFEEAKTPDPGMVKFKEAKGIGNKVKVIAENIKDGAAEASENERVRRAEIQSHESYRTLLEGERASRQARINPLSRTISPN